MSREHTVNASHLPHLMRKDWRQISPLIGVCVGVGLLIYLLLMLTPETSSFPLEIAVGLPLLFAAGVGAFLISNEKDLRTMVWLRSLPIDRKALLKSKAWIAVASLSLIWIVSVLSWVLFNGLFSRDAADSRLVIELMERPLLAVAFLVYTFYALFAGIAISWRSRSTTMSLFLLLPVAFAPWVVSWGLTQIVTRLVGYYYVTDVFRDGLHVITFALSLLLMLRLSWVWGTAYLMADASPSVASVRSGLSARTSRSSYTAVDWLSRKTSTPDVAMLRQFFVQNRLVLLGLLAIYAAAYAMFVCELWKRDESAFAVISIVLYILATCWLGVVTFHGDRLNNRIRFYSDRGVAPFKVWLTRQIVPVATLMVIAAVIACSFRWWVTIPLFGTILTVELLWLIAFAGLMTVYGFSQWVSQVSWNPIIASISAPLMLFLLGLYASFSYGFLGAPIWVVASTALIPWFATALGMKRWMDSGYGWRFMRWHLCSMVFLAAVPLLPLAYYAVTIRPMDSSVRARLEELSTRDRVAHTRVYDFYLSFWDIDSVKGQDKEGRLQSWGVEAIDYNREKHQQVIVDLKKQFEKGPVRIQWGSGDLSLLASIVINRAIACDVTANEASIASYREALDVYTSVFEVHHLSRGLWDQEEADQMARVLVREMRRPGSRQRIGEPLYGKGIRILGRTEDRDNARRVALAKAWANYHRADLKKKRSKSEYDFDAWDMPNHFPPGSLPDQYFGDPLKDRCVVELLALLDEKEPEAIEARRLRIAQQWNEELDTSCNDVDQDFELDPFLRRSRYPGAQWRAGWEQQAAELVAAYKP